MNLLRSILWWSLVLATAPLFWPLLTLWRFRLLMLPVWLLLDIISSLNQVWILTALFYSIAMFTVIFGQPFPPPHWLLDAVPKKDGENACNETEPRL